MSFHVGNNTFGVTAPNDATVSESRKSSRVTRNVVPDSSGVIVRLRGSKQREADITLRGFGDPGFSSVSAGSFTLGTPKIVSAEGTQKADGSYSDMEITAKLYSNGNGTLIGGEVTAPDNATAFQFTDYGVTAATLATTTEIRVRKMLDLGTPVLTSTDGYASGVNVAYNPTFEATLSGVGALPAEVALGAAPPGISYITAGIGLVESVDESYELGQEQAWEASIFVAPSAT